MRAHDPPTLSAIDVIERYLTAIATQDWDGLAACLAEDVERVGPYGDTYVGKGAYVAFLRDLMPRLPGYRMDVDRVVYADGGRIALAELSETVDVDGTPLVTPESLVFDLTDQATIGRIGIYLQRRDG